MASFNQKRVVVTGGAGFIGSHLVERLIKDGHTVSVIDNFSTGLERNLESVKNHPRLKVFKADITDFNAMLEIFEGVDWVFHLAALSNLIPSIQKPLDYFESNVFGTASILEASRKRGVKRFIYTASSSCYGIPDEYPTKETAAIRPQYPYAESKYLGEHLALHYAKLYKLPLVSLRPFNIYGPRVRTDSGYGAALGVFLAQKANQKPLTIVGDGTQTRDFVFVTDAVDAFLKAAESNCVGEIFNIGSGHPESVNTLVTLLGSEKKVYLPKRPGEPDQTFADITKITTRLHWKPIVSIKEGVKIVLKEIDNWKNAPVWTESTIQEATQDWFKYLS
ncbi:MAG: SDR family oxidoreductase [Candidatus Liptonbacteria bacterium]|nr:SDR family oxidoreductase [Candidatus Liptonbacteria bacterium]